MKKTILPILSHPTPSLRERSVEITKKEIASSHIQELIAPMLATMYDDDGIGLAAPQIGKNIRLIVIGKGADQSLKDDLVLINPTWEKTTKKTDVDTEGCLSVPNVLGKVKRYKKIDVQALTPKGKKISFSAKGFFSRVIQHEVDHLDGILFIDKAIEAHHVDPLTSQKTPL